MQRPLLSSRKKTRASPRCSVAPVKRDLSCCTKKVARRSNPMPTESRSPKTTKKSQMLVPTIQENKENSAQINSASGEEYAAVECRRLREELECVLEDRSRQEDEIVALRALARSLKEEVEAIKRPSAVGRRPHEFFKLDLDLEELRAENNRLAEQLDMAKRKYARVRSFVQDQLPAYRLAAVKATAELQSALSQLEEEQAECDRLRKQIARYQARSSEPTSFSTADDGFHGNLEARKLNRAREELLRECLSDEISWKCRIKRSPQNKHWIDRSRESESGLRGDLQEESNARVLLEPQQGECGTTSLMEQSVSLDDGISSLEAELRELHTSLEIAQSIAETQPIHELS